VDAALAQALPVPGTSRWTLPATEAHLAAVESVFRLEMLAGSGSSRSYHRLWREHRTHGDPQVRLTLDNTPAAGAAHEVRPAEA
jgi:hypothetical protein